MAKQIKTSNGYMNEMDGAKDEGKKENGKDKKKDKKCPMCGKMM